MRAARLPARPRSKDWKPPAIPQPGIPEGRGCCRQGLPQRGTATSFASSWPAAGRGREQSRYPEEQIKAVTDELWQEQLWHLPSLLTEKQFPQQLSCLGSNPTHHKFGHQCCHGRTTFLNHPGAGEAEGQCKASAGRLGRESLPNSFILG